MAANSNTELEIEYVDISQAKYASQSHYAVFMVYIKAKINN